MKFLPPKVESVVPSCVEILHNVSEGMVVDFVWADGSLCTLDHGIGQIWAACDEGINKFPKAVPVLNTHVSVQFILRTF